MAVTQSGQSGHQQLALNTSGMSGLSEYLDSQNTNVNVNTSIISLNMPSSSRTDNRAEVYQNLMATAEQADFQLVAGSSTSTKASSTITKPPS